MTGAAYLDSPWPAEDGGPQRLQTPRSGAGLALQAGERLACTTRNTLLSTMTVLGAPGEVYLLTHSALRAHAGLPTTAQVERIDPLTLRTQQRSPRLAGGPMWPGGMALHRNGTMHVVYGRFVHQLDRACQPLARLRLPVEQAYNSFVLLDNGRIVTKNLSDTHPAILSVVDPDTLRFAAPDTACPEPSVARLSAIGNTVYVVGVRTVFRYHWDDAGDRLFYAVESFVAPTELSLVDLVSGEDAVAKTQAGADLVQCYSGLVYRGPRLVADCVQAMAAKREAHHA